MGRRILYICDCCGSAIDLDKQVGVLNYCSVENAADESWTLNMCYIYIYACLEKISFAHN